MRGGGDPGDLRGIGAAELDAFPKDAEDGEARVASYAEVAALETVGALVVRASKVAAASRSCVGVSGGCGAASG